MISSMLRPLVCFAMFFSALELSAESRAISATSAFQISTKAFSPITGEPPVLVAGGSFQRIFYTITLRNASDVPVTALQATMDFQTDLAEAKNVSVLDLASSELQINSQFDGFINKNLLLGADILPPRSEAIIQMWVSITAGDSPGDYRTVTKSFGNAG